MGENNKQWLGTAMITILLSVIGATATTSGRIASMEIKLQTQEKQNIELKKEFVERVKCISEKQDCQTDAINEVNKSIIRMEGKLDMKQDKKWRDD